MPPAHILKDKHIAVARKKYGRGISVGESLGAVGRSRHQHRILPAAYGTIYIRIEHDSIPHTNRNVSLQSNVVGRRSRGREVDLR